MQIFGIYWRRVVCLLGGICCRNSPAGQWMNHRDQIMGISITTDDLHSSYLNLWYEWTICTREFLALGTGVSQWVRCGFSRVEIWKMFCCRSVKGTQDLSHLLSSVRGGVEYLYSSYLLHCHERYIISHWVLAKLGPGRNQWTVQGRWFGRSMRSMGDRCSHGLIEQGPSMRSST